MLLVWTPNGWDDYLYWQQNDGAMLSKVNDLIKDVRRNPFTGLGKPEPLKYELKGFWSRRITQEHRLIYKVEKGQLQIIGCRHHY